MGFLNLISFHHEAEARGGGLTPFGGESSLCFHIEPDCILSKLRMINSSLFTNNRSVSEGLSYAIIAHLDSNPADYPLYIINVFTMP